MNWPRAVVCIYYVNDRSSNETLPQEPNTSKSQEARCMMKGQEKQLMTRASAHRNQLAQVCSWPKSVLGLGFSDLQLSILIYLDVKHMFFATKKMPNIHTAHNVTFL